jgi:hypothetical protein
MVLLILIALVATFLTIIFMAKPSNDRDWQPEFAKLSKVDISGDEKQITISNIRNWKYSKTGIDSEEFIPERTYNIDNLEKVWFVVTYWGPSNAAAHTYFVFDFTDQDPVALSVEARREKGEVYNGFNGAFNKFELIYLWGTERDFTGRRTYKDEERVFMYPLKMDDQYKKALFLHVAKSTEDIRNNPQFYNTLVSNCTNTLAKFANQIHPGTIPFHYALFLTGYSSNLLYKLGYIPNDLSYEETAKKAYITDFTNENYENENLSKILREKLAQ